jgi:hypothetical protein
LLTDTFGEADHDVQAGGSAGHARLGQLAGERVEQRLATASVVASLAA